MASKTISVSTQAYDRLRAHRHDRGDSFSRVIMRARWDDTTVTGAELLERITGTPPCFSDLELDRIEAAKCADVPPVDKWSSR